MRRSLIVFIVAAGTIASAAGARKEEPYQPSPPTITTTPFSLAVAGFDRDGDMKVTRAEYDEGVKRSFAAGDEDKDGSIGLIELTGWAQATLGNANAIPGLFDFDRDGNDKISFAEYSALFARRFAAMDANRDGTLDRSELVLLIATPGSDRRRHGGSGGEGSGEAKRRPPSE